MKKTTFLLITFFLFVFSAQSQSSNTDSLLSELKKAKEDTIKVNLLREIGISLIYQRPPEAITYFKQAYILAKKLAFNPGLERNYAATSTAYAFNAKYDSAKIYIDTAIFYALKVGDINRLALVYLNRADAYENLQEYTAALKDCDTAMKYAEQSGNKDRLARIYNIISDIYEQQNQYSVSLNYLNKAEVLHKEMNNIQMVGQAFFDRAQLYHKMNEPLKAIESYYRAIEIAESVKDINNLSAYYGELANTLITEKRYREAEPLARKALQYAKQVGNIRQEAVIHGVFYNLYYEQKDYNNAITSGLAGYNILKEIKDLDREQLIAASLAEAYLKTGNTKEAYIFLKISKDLNDSLVKQRFNDETAKLQTTFNVKQKDKEIQLLNKDKELQSQILSRQRFLMAGSVALVLLLVVGIGLLINRNRLRQQMKELELRNQIAADLHDEVGSSLSSIHMLSQIANKKQGSTDASQKEILDRMSVNAKETMDKMGDIVWMIKPGESEGSSLKNRMERFAQEICSSKNISLEMEIEKLETIKLSMPQRKNLYLIFKEAINNAVKYSGTEKIIIKAYEQNKKLRFLVQDFGKGFDVSIVKKGNGLDNMQNRAKELNGKLSIESLPGNGTSINLTMPV
ncbi:MAG: sensor histidine kinase [Chitinophagaceae bacterium]